MIYHTLSAIRDNTHNVSVHVSLLWHEPNEQQRYLHLLFLSLLCVLPPICRASRTDQDPNKYADGQQYDPDEFRTDMMQGLHNETGNHIRRGVLSQTEVGG